MPKRLVRLLSRAAVATLVSFTLALAGLAELPARGALAATPTGFGPHDLQSAYGIGDTTGAGETVAVVTPYDDPDAESDLAVYRSQYNLAACTTANGCFRKVNQTGGAAYPAQGTGIWATAGAESLDAISGLCPGCHLLLVEANSTGIPDIGQAENEAVTLGAKFIANGITFDEVEAGSAELTYDADYFDHPGVAITAPSGDSGYTGTVNYPADSQYVTSVGGTVLTDANGAYSQALATDTTSGCSEFEPKPSWQADTGCGGRTLNDVSAVANDVAYYHGGSWATGGGTQVSAAVVAAWYALLAASGVNLGTNPAQYLYTHASMLTDITSGSTGTCTPSDLCTAGTGYDGPSGVGALDAVMKAPSTGAAPAVYDKISGNFEVYATSSSGTVEQDAYVPATGWHGWRNLGAPGGITLTGVPAALYDTGTGNFEIYATGSDGSLEQIAYVPGAGWSSWKNITGTSGPAIASSPAAFYNPQTSRVEVYAAGTNNNLEQAYYAPGWSWRDFGGSVAGTPAVVDDTITGNTEVYVKGTDGALYQEAWTGTTWTTLRSLGGAISGSPSAVVDSYTGNMEVYVTGSGTTGTSIEQAAWKSGAGWSWHNLGGSVTGSPSALVDTATGHPEVYATGTAGTLQETAYTTSTGWTSWGTIGSGTTITGSPDAVYDQDTSALEVYVITSGSVSVIAWKGSWGSWNSLGSTFTAP